jgi:hypothetical protein
LAERLEKNIDPISPAPRQPVPHRTEWSPRLGRVSTHFSAPDPDAGRREPEAPGV